MEPLVQDLYQAIKQRDIQQLQDKLNAIEELPFWAENFSKLLNKLVQDHSNQSVDQNESFWLDVQRAFIDAVPQ